MKRLKKLAKIVRICVDIWHSLIELWEVVLEEEEEDNDDEENTSR